MSDTPEQQSSQVPTMDEFNALSAKVDTHTTQIAALDTRVTHLENAVTTPPPSGPQPSPDGTKTSTAGTVLIDDGMNQWRISTGRTVEWAKSGTAVFVAAGTTSNVALIEKWKASCYQQNTAGNWYSWTGSGPWVAASGDPSSPPPTVSGNYSVRNGQILTPSGAKFTAEGVCLLDAVIGTAVTSSACLPLLKDFPTTNFVHIVNFSWAAPLSYANIIDWLTAKGIVVQIGNYATFPPVATGDALNQEAQWVAKLATQYKNNPRVWFCCCNEPQDWYTGLPNGSITAEHKAVYNAVRNTAGSNAIIGICGTGCIRTAGLDLSAYPPMRNVIWNVHYYNWLANYSADYNANVTALKNIIADHQTVSSADGIIPCLVGEYGNATDGNNVDAGGSQAVQAVLDVSPAFAGNAAFVYPYWPTNMGGKTNADQLTQEGTGALTGYGHQVATSFAASTQVTIAAAEATQPWPSWVEKLREFIQSQQTEEPTET